MISVCSSSLVSGVDKYHDQIVRALSEGKCRSELYRELQAIGLTCGKTAAYDYFNLVAKRYDIELIPLESCSPKQKQLRKNIQKHIYISRKKIFDYLWFDEKLDIEPEYFEYLLNKYPVITLLYSFINKYKESSVKLIKKFAESMEKDLEAIENAVSSPFSNGFVEGTNSKLKMVKRTMYGRCGCRLLAAKLMVRV